MAGLRRDVGRAAGRARGDRRARPGPPGLRREQRRRSPCTSRSRRSPTTSTRACSTSTCAGIFLGMRAQVREMARAGLRVDREHGVGRPGSPACATSASTPASKHGIVGLTQEHGDGVRRPGVRVRGLPERDPHAARGGLAAGPSSMPRRPAPASGEVGAPAACSGARADRSTRAVMRAPAVTAWIRSRRVGATAPGRAGRVGRAATLGAFG